MTVNPGHLLMNSTVLCRWARAGFRERGIYLAPISHFWYLRHQLGSLTHPELCEGTQLISQVSEMTHPFHSKLCWRAQRCREQQWLLSKGQSFLRKLGLILFLCMMLPQWCYFIRDKIKYFKVTDDPIATSRVWNWNMNSAGRWKRNWAGSATQICSAIMAIARTCQRNYRRKYPGCTNTLQSIMHCHYSTTPSNIWCF